MRQSLRLWPPSDQDQRLVVVGRRHRHQAVLAVIRRGEYLENLLGPMPRPFEHLATFVADREAEGAPLPKYVMDEFDAYMRCGILAHGFIRLVCDCCTATQNPGLLQL